jgi:hypothetical protein
LGEEIAICVDHELLVQEHLGKEIVVLLARRS